MSQRLDRVINGEPYTFEQNEWGWAVRACGSRTDRFHRNYQVTVYPSGAPKKCSCPSCVTAGKWCKHLQEAERIYREQHPEVTEALRREAERCGIQP